MNINQTSYMAQAAQASYAELNSGSGGTGLRDQLLLQLNKGGWDGGDQDGQAQDY